jgi:iron(III) transport system substrate-binding protein
MTSLPTPALLAPKPLPRLAWLAPLLALFACGGADYDLVVYTAADQVHSEPLLERFQSETGLRVRMEFDVEANKTVGLVSRLRQEAAAGNTRCDVFWNNEIANTVALAEDGLLAPYDSPAASDIPEAFRDGERRWTGFAARARVLIVNRELLGDRPLPASTADLLSAAWAAEAGIARPLTGTTLTHACVLYTVLGDQAAREFWAAVKQKNDAGELNLASGNGPLMRAVGSGAYTFGFTDTDDFNVARVRGYPVTQVVPDQEPDGLGALLIPNTVAITAGAPHRAAAERFVDWLLRPETEALLAASDSANVPVRTAVARPEHVLDVGQLRLMPVDWSEVGRRLPELQAELAETFLD